MAATATGSTIPTDVLDRLTDGIRQLATEEGWRRWLVFQSWFYTYSANNVVLIAMQRPDASRVAGFHTWLRVNRHVRKGERGIRILAPVVARAKVTDDQGHEESIAVAVKGFRVATVFALEQTDGEELPTPPCHVLTDDAPAGVLAALDQVAVAKGWRVEEADGLGGPNGVTIPARRLIQRVAGLAPAAKVKTTAHELGHALLHSDEGAGEGRCRELMETEAESVAWIVCDALGVRSDAYSFGYLAVWGGGTDEVVAAVQASATRIARAARTILEAVESVGVAA